MNSIGLTAARRAIAVSGTLPALHDPLVVQLVPPAGLAVGDVPWGLGPFVPAGSYREISTALQPGGLAAAVSAALQDAAGRTLVVVVRDAHRYAVAADAVSRLLAGRPDAIVVEMGLPVWRPAASAYVVSYGAARSNGFAVAEALGLISPQHEGVR